MTARRVAPALVVVDLRETAARADAGLRAFWTDHTSATSSCGELGATDCTTHWTSWSSGRCVLDLRKAHHGSWSIHYSLAWVTRRYGPGDMLAGEVHPTAHEASQAHDGVTADL